MSLENRRVLLIVCGGIAAYKVLDLVRDIRRAGGAVTPVLTAGGARFVTALSLAALAEARVHTDLFDLTAEAEMGHIQLSRSADLVLVCPATADLLARMAAGLADDLATTLLMATRTPVMAAPAMNVAMWQHPATIANVATLRARGVTILDPDVGPMACGEHGPGRLPERSAIMAALHAHFASGPLAGRHILVTAGPTHEPVDPVRYLANRSSGKQGFAIAGALAARGARVTLVAGPVALATPPGVTRIDVETARAMADAVFAALPADAAVMVAAVADWRPAEPATAKVKKAAGSAPPVLALAENPDILKALGHHAERPRLVIGFAAETDDVLAHARAKLASKGADLIVANDVSGSVMGGNSTQLHLVSAAGVETLPPGPKTDGAALLADRIAALLAAGHG